MGGRPDSNLTSTTAPMTWAIDPTLPLPVNSSVEDPSSEIRGAEASAEKWRDRRVFGKDGGGEEEGRERRPAEMQREEEEGAGDGVAGLRRFFEKRRAEEELRSREETRRREAIAGWKRKLQREREREREREKLWRSSPSSSCVLFKKGK